MPTTKRPLKRYSILDRCFSNTRRNYTFDGLKEAINDWMLYKDPESKGISTRQLRDDIAFMKSSDGRYLLSSRLFTKIRNTMIESVM
jgi:hypothetical protein